MSDKNPKAPEPMDPGARETSTPGKVVRNPRNAYALDTLVAEVQDICPEAAFDYEDADSWQVSHSVIISDYDQPLLVGVLERAALDARIEDFIHEEEDGERVLISVWPNRQTRDSRDGFGLAEILAVFLEDDLDPACDRPEWHDGDCGPVEPGDDPDEVYVGASEDVTGPAKTPEPTAKKTPARKAPAKKRAVR